MMKIKRNNNDNEGQKRNINSDEGHKKKRNNLSNKG